MIERTNAGENGFNLGHALIIGTGTDNDGKIDQAFTSTINDAEWLAKVLKEESLCWYPEKQVHILTGENATRENVDTALKDINSDISEQQFELEGEQYCTFVFFFSGHGSRSRDGTTTLILTKGSDDNNRIDGSYLMKKITGIPARKLILVNSCYSGGFYPTLGDNDQDGDKVFLGNSPLTKEQIERMKTTGQGIYVFTAAQRDEVANALFKPKYGPVLKNSPFVIGLSRGFAGKGNRKGDRFVDCGNLVIECTKWLGENKIKQNPSMDYKGSRFIVGCFTEGAASNSAFAILDDELTVDLTPSGETESSATPQIPSRVVNTTYSVTNGNQFNGPITARVMDFSKNKTINNGGPALWQRRYP